MARVPQPVRTNRGAGVGATITLAIDYYRPADGAGPDHGVLSGRDENGPWELHFANPTELETELRHITTALAQIATEAREAAADERSAGRTIWLKAIGAQGLPADEVWWDERNRDTGIDFPYRPKSVKQGDLLVVYAAGTGKVVGVMKITGDRWSEAGRNERWPYRMEARVLAAVPVSEGFALNLLDVERKIGKSIRQKSHIRLSDAEADIALDAFELGDA
jgi:hypothetical protein